MILIPKSLSFLSPSFRERERERNEGERRKRHLEEERFDHWFLPIVPTSQFKSSSIRVSRLLLLSSSSLSISFFFFFFIMKEEWVKNGHRQKNPRSKRNDWCWVLFPGDWTQETFLREREREKKKSWKNWKEKEREERRRLERKTALSLYQPNTSSRLQLEWDVSLLLYLSLSASFSFLHPVLLFCPFDSRFKKCTFCSGLESRRRRDGTERKKPSGCLNWKEEEK